MTGEMLLIEKSGGLLARSRVAGVAPAEVLLAHVATQFAVLMVQAALTLACILVAFQVPCRGPVVWLVVLTLLQVNCIRDEK